jgi:molecular chaperone DnaK
MQASMKLGEAMYQAQQGPPGGEAEAAADDGVVDAEFEDVSGDKK